MPLDSTPSPLEAALQAHAPRLLPGAVEQLARVLGPDLEGVPAGIIPDVIRNRLSEPEYQRFFSPVGADGRPTIEAQLAARAPAHRGNLLSGRRGRGA